MKEIEQDCEVWLHEAFEGKVFITKNREELFQYINVLRQRLIKIASVYGYRSSETIMFSQYLDKFIVEYQKMK